MADRRPEDHDGGPRFLSRRDFLWRAGGGLGGIALAFLLDSEGLLAASPLSLPGRGVGGEGKHPHFPPKARRVIELFMAGAVSQVDTFDEKPELAKRHGQPLTGKGKLDLFFGQPGTLLKSPWKFRRYGQCGKAVSDLLPNLAQCVDDMAFLHTLQARSSSHGPAMFQMNTGFVITGHPSLGSWVAYGLGSECEDLPAFVVLPDGHGMPPSGPANWSAGFLPAQYQGAAFRTGGDPILDLRPPATYSAEDERASRALLVEMNRRHLEANPGDSDLAARIQAYELAARMQLSAPRVMDISGETPATRRLYGLDNPVTEGYGRSCLLARRLIERGVRFVQVYCGAHNTFPRVNWDAHEDIVDNHGKNAAIMDLPTAGLLKDLKARGLLEDTLVLWTTEFGRMPISQGKGRDHNPHGFTVWLAGGGAKPGVSYGATDEFGYKVERDPVTIYDFHATILHLLGLDHKRLTYYYNGRAQRLTDVHGEVVTPILA